MLKKYLLILIGSLSLILTMVKSGWNYSYGVGFWGANGHDGIWHIALAESLARGTLNSPIFAGFAIQNYHIGFDLVLAIANKITNIPIPNLYFQIFPVIFTLLIGYLTYEFTLRWTKSSRSAFFATFLIYFGGSFAYLIGRGESTFWSQQAISTLINPPFALSLIFILLGLINLLKNKKILGIIFFGLLIEVKVYAGILILVGLFLSKNFKVFFGTLLVSLLLYFNMGNFSTGLVIFQPFWFLETMMNTSDHVGWAKFGEAMLNYKSGDVYFKGFIAYAVAFLIFILGNFGTRIFFIKDVFKKLDSTKILMLGIIGAGIIIPTFFVQSGTPWNTIQFLYYSLFLSGILAGITLSNIKTSMNRIIEVTVILLTIPTSILTLKDVYIPSRPPAKLSVDEISALKFLSSQPDGIVLTYPFDQKKAKEAEGNPPRPLYLYASTAYVAAYSKHQVFLEDEINLDITGYAWKDRRTEIEKWYKETDQEKTRKFLSDNNIKYVYWVKPQRALLGEGQLGLEKIFENGEAMIYVVK